MQTVAPDTSDRKYFTLAPNIILALCRDPYDLAVWLVVKLVAGDIGECILSAEDGAALAGMSTGKWVEARQHLISVGALIGEVRRDPGYPQATWHLRIPDLWPANVRWREQTGDSLKSRLADIRERRKSLHHMKALLGRSEEPSPHEGEPSPGEAFPSPHEGKPSPHETKKNHVEEPKEEPEEACKLTGSLSTDSWRKMLRHFEANLNHRSATQAYLKPATVDLTDNVLTVTIHSHSGAVSIHRTLKDRIRSYANYQWPERSKINRPFIVHIAGPCGLITPETN